MTSRPIIRSIKNPALQRAREVLAGRDRFALALEGDRLVDDALGAGLAFELALVAESRDARAAELERAGVHVERIEDELLGRVSSLKSSPGCMAIASVPRARALDELAAEPDALVLGVAGVADPGNLGALARSAEAVGARGIVIASGGASPWNDKSLRGSMGSLLRVPVFAVDEAASAQAALARRGFRGARAATRDGVESTQFDWRGPLILWVGSETGAWPRGLDQLERVTIRMRGAVESLNVAVATSVLLFTAVAARERAP